MEEEEEEEEEEEVYRILLVNILNASGFFSVQNTPPTTF
jgi:hypothetical protein